jgi:hypothetical protein
MKLERKQSDCMRDLKRIKRERALIKGMIAYLEGELEFLDADEDYIRTLMSPIYKYDK